MDSLEARLRDRAETLGLSLEQKTKAMKQRDKKVTCTMEPKRRCCFDPRTVHSNHCRATHVYVE